MNPSLFKTSWPFVLVGSGISEEDFLPFKGTSFEKWAGSSHSNQCRGSAPVKNIYNAKMNE